MMSEKDNALMFLASILSQKDHERQGFSGAPRWGTLREDLKEKYIEAATQMVDSWVEGELVADEKRKQLEADANNHSL